MLRILSGEGKKKQISPHFGRKTAHFNVFFPLFSIFDRILTTLYNSNCRWKKFPHNPADSEMLGI